MRSFVGWCAALALFVAAPAAHAASQVTLIEPAQGATFSVVDDAVARVVYSAALVVDPTDCLSGSWYIERRDAGAGDDAWHTVIGGPVTQPALATSELRPAGDSEVRAALRCDGAAPVYSAVHTVHVTSAPTPGTAPSGPSQDCLDERAALTRATAAVRRARAAVRRRSTPARRRALARAKRRLAEARADEKLACG